MSKKRIVKRVAICCVMVILAAGAVLSFSLKAGAEEMYLLPVTVTYGQTEARTILDKINELRTGNNGQDAWCWSPDNKEKEYYENLNSLVYDPELEKIAMRRAAEIALSYSHTRPDGTSCFTAYEGTCYANEYAGENIAAGYETADAVNKGWREDDQPYEGQGHRMNMLNPNFTAVGIGHVYYDNTHYWVEEFSGNTSGGSLDSANDETTEELVTVADSYIYDWRIYPNGNTVRMKCGQTISTDQLKLFAKIKDNWGGKDGFCPVNYPVSVSSANLDAFDVSGKGITARKEGTFSFDIGDTGLQATLTVVEGENGSGSGSGVPVDKTRPIQPPTPTPTPTPIPKPTPTPTSTPTPTPTPTPTSTPAQVPDSGSGQIPVSAEDETDSDGKEVTEQKKAGISVELRVTGKTVSITLASKKKKVEVPQTILDAEGRKYTVTRLDAKAFAACRNVKQIILPKSIKSVSREAFRGMKTRKISITLDASLTEKEVQKLGKKLKKAGFRGNICQAESG